MNKKLKYIIFIISVLIFISGCKNNGTNPSTFEELGKYRGTWVSDNFYILDINSSQWNPSSDTMTIKINSDTDVVVDNIAADSVKHLPDTVDSYDVYVSTYDVPPDISSEPAIKVIEVYYKLEFTSYNSAKATMIFKLLIGVTPLTIATQKAELKKIN